MLEYPDGGPLQWTVGFALVAICWALIRNAFEKLARPVSAQADITKVDQDVMTQLMPPQPHLEIALDPPTGLHWSNPSTAYRFENEFCSGEYLFFHPPTEGEEVSKAKLDFADYFKGKSRIWELRVQFNFKQAPSADRDLFFGTESEEYVPLSAAAKQVLGLCVATVKAAVGGLYHSPGDDPKRMLAGEEVEKPGFSLPLWAFDQFIVTPEGEARPDLMDRQFQSMGSKRYGRVKQYVQEMSELRQNIAAGPTYTFAFWGTSRFADIINWRLVGVPMVGPIDLDKFIGRPPLHCVLYDLAPSEKGEKRHLHSRKRYYFRAAIWSSLRRPRWERMQALTGGALQKPPETASAGKASKRGLASRWEQLLGRAALSCCGDFASLRTASQKA
eukprot:CAMPEP_0183466244 /NCGR_PEP_ID=MMETSP0370-20130417/148651_1 /TAXON_ID=268820 /ORGANISM="Peridinium aciculiferum, Strain PAER-2" /LENGTH=387 /DNA_ID=CAMNT_0025658507 /DNA_START=1 /DNA_END=1164 /DNA_ORIENTATION=-